MKNYFKELFKNSQSGQSLVELLVAIGLASLLIPAILTGIAASRGGRAQEDQRVQAVSLLKSSQEAVRSVAQKDWSGLATNGTYHAVISGNAWILSSGSTTSNGFTTSVVITDAMRNSSGAIVASGGTEDPSTKKIVTTVSWTTPINSAVSATTYFSRNKNSAYTETTAEQFDKGITTNTQITNVSGGEIKLANNNKAKWCSPSFSTSTIDLPDGPPVAVIATASAASPDIPNDVYVAVAPNTSNSIKLAHVNVTANSATPTATQRGKFTLNSSEYSNPSYVPTGIDLDNNFKTNDVEYYKSSAGNTYALIATDLPTKEVIAVWVNNDNPADDSNTSGEFQDPVNKIYKYKTFFNTRIYAGAYNNPSANSSETTNAGDNNGYSNGSNAYLNDGSVAYDSNSGSGTGTSCTGNDKDKHRFYDYGFSVPSGATIDGIEISLIARSDSTSGTPKICIQLSWDGGTTWTTAKTTNNLTTSYATYNVGGSSDNWGRTWNSSDFSDANFRVRVIDVASSTSRDFYLNWVGAKVNYDGTSTASNDQAPYGYGGKSITVLGDRAYVASSGFLYAFDLSNIDSKTAVNGLDQVGCRIELDGYDCSPNTGVDRKYDPGETGTTWSKTTSPAHNDCSDGGNIELNATNGIEGVKVGSDNYIFVAVGAGTNPEFEIVNATSVPDSASSPSISSNTCGTISSGNSGWKMVGSLDFNTQSNTEEAANSVYAKSDGTRAYISSNGGIDGNNNGVPDSKQFYIINTTNKTAPAFLSGSPGSPSYGPTSGFYYGTGANAQLYPRRSLTVLNGERVVLVGKDETTDANDAQEYQVLNSENEASPAYCAGINFDQGFNDLTSVSEADSDNYVYMVANTSLNELKIIEGGPDDAIYVANGTFESQVFNSTSSSMFNRFFATSTVPAQTTLSYQVAIEPPISGSCTGVTYNYVGPDGTNGTYFTSTAELPKSSDGSGYENPGQCMRYKAFMTSTSQLQTPTLFDFGVNYSL